MSAELHDEIARLRKINQALIERVERSTDQQGNAYSLFQTAISLEDQVRLRTQELSRTLNDLEKSNHQLKVAKEAAEDANLSKTRFLAAASHDVLQPLNASLLMMSSLAATQTCAEGNRLCSQVERSLETMDELLRTLLYMSRLDAGDIKPHWQTVSIDALFDSIASDFEPVAELRGLELRVRHCDLHVWSDPTMLRRLLQNIVANALRYTSSGGALLIAGRHDDKVHIRIADTGSGIPADRFQDIFVEFQRFDDHGSRDDSSSGLGLGLAIVDRMVKTLGHRLTLNSCLGRGSCFSLFLDLAKTPKPVSAPSGYQLTDSTNLIPLADTRVLIIENDLIALQAMEALLNQWGCKLRLASSTHEALGALSNNKGWYPDLIVADQHLDENDRGTSAIRTLRQLIGHEIPAVVVTANPSESLWRMADQGRIEVMPKPIKPAQLRALLTHLLARSVPERASTESAQQPDILPDNYSLNRASTSNSSS